MRIENEQALRAFWKDLAPGQPFDEDVAIAALLETAKSQFTGLFAIRRCYPIYAEYYKRMARRSGERPKGALRRLDEYHKGHLRGLRRMGDVADFWLERARARIQRATLSP
jgi:hypothetical protein